MSRATLTFIQHRRHIINAIELAGYHHVAKATNLAPMQVWRYAKRIDSVRAVTHYKLAEWAGVQLQLPLTAERKRRRVAG